MLIYEKKVEETNKIFGTMYHIPSDEDEPLVFKNASSEPVEPSLDYKYLDDGHGGINMIDNTGNSINLHVSIVEDGEEVEVIPTPQVSPVTPGEDNAIVGQAVVGKAKVGNGGNSSNITPVVEQPAVENNPSEENEQPEENNSSEEPTLYSITINSNDFYFVDTETNQEVTEAEEGTEIRINNANSITDSTVINIVSGEILVGDNVLENGDSLLYPDEKVFVICDSNVVFALADYSDTNSGR